jgi:hypothetical protein
MLDRTAGRFDVTPSRLVADGGYGSAGRCQSNRGSSTCGATAIARAAI